MRQILSIFRCELRGQLASPAAWVAGFGFLLAMGLLFLQLLDRFDEMVLNLIHLRQGHGSVPDLITNLLRPWFAYAAQLLSILIALLSMRSIAAERQQGTLDLMASLPVRPWQLVCGKYAALSVLITGLLLPLWLTPAWLALYCEPAGLDWGSVAAAWLGLWFSGLAFAAVGLAMSSLARSQLLAAMLTLLLLAGLWSLELAATTESSSVQALAQALSLPSHTAQFFKGRLLLKDLIYLVSLAALGLVVAHRAVAHRRIRAG